MLSTGFVLNPQLLLLLCLWPLGPQMQSTHGFQPAPLAHFGTTRSNKHSAIHPLQAMQNDNDFSTCRRSILSGMFGSSLVGLGILSLPQQALAGIDVSGLPFEGGGGNPSLANQLKAYDGSGITRVKVVQAMKKETTTISTTARSTSSGVLGVDQDPPEPLATWAYRANPGFNPSLTRVGVVGNLYRYNDMVQAPVGSKRRAIGVQFEFPADWLQLDRSIGGIQYVDQRNGDKLYVFRAPLPDNTTTTTTTTLATISKSTIGDLIFNPQGSLAKSGQTIEDYKVTSAQILSEPCPSTKDNDPSFLCGAIRRRFKIKYATVTGNGLRVERRALVDAYQVENDIYMLMTSSNAVKFEQADSLERETVEKIVASFRIDI